MANGFFLIDSDTLPGSLTLTAGLGGVVAPDASVSAGPTINSIVTLTTGGTLAAATYFYVVTAIGSAGETLASNEVSITTTGTTSSVIVTWQSVIGAASYRIYRGTTAGGESAWFAGAASGSVGGTFTDTGAAGTAGTPSKVSTFLPTRSMTGRAHAALLTLPHNPDKQTYVISFGPIAATVATDLFAIEAGPFMVTRIRRVVIMNPGVQTTSAAVNMLLLRTTTAGTGGVVTPAVLDPADFPFTGIARVAPTALGTAGATLYNFDEVVPATIAGAGVGFEVWDFGGDSQLHKCPTIAPGITNGIAFRHPGAAGAAGLYGYVEFTEEPF